MPRIRKRLKKEKIQPHLDGITFDVYLYDDDTVDMTFTATEQENYWQVLIRPYNLHILCYGSIRQVVSQLIDSTSLAINPLTLKTPRP